MGYVRQCRTIQYKAVLGYKGQFMSMQDRAETVHDTVK